MSLPKIIQVTGRAVPVPGDDIDTDRIIPARFMKCVTFDGLGEYLFYDSRFDEDGVELASTIRHHRQAGFAEVLVFMAADAPAPEGIEPMIRIGGDRGEDGALCRNVNAVIAAAPGTWL